MTLQIKFRMSETPMVFGKYQKFLQLVYSFFQLTNVFTTKIRLKNFLQFFLKTYLICTGDGFPDPRDKVCCFPTKLNKLIE